MLYKLEYGNLYGDVDYLKSSYLESMDEDTKHDALLFAPPHVRNAIVGVFREQIYLHFGNASKADHFIIVLLNISQCCSRNLSNARCA